MLSVLKQREVVDLFSAVDGNEPLPWFLKFGNRRKVSGALRCFALRFTCPLGDDTEFFVLVTLGSKIRSLSKKRFGQPHRPDEHSHSGQRSH